MSSYFYLTLDTTQEDSKSWFELTLDTDEHDRVFRFIPDMYSKNLTMNQIAQTECKEMNILEKEIKRAFDNNFLATADVDGISDYEKLLKIQPDVLTEDLELRRVRASNKLSMIAPYSKIFLQKKLDSLFGKGKWFMDVLYSDITLVIDVDTESNILFEQVVKDIREIMPANMVLEANIIKPFTHIYLGRYYTHQQLSQFTQAELSQHTILPHMQLYLTQFTHKDLENKTHGELSSRK